MLPHTDSLLTEDQSVASRLSPVQDQATAPDVSGARAPFQHGQRAQVDDQPTH
ncbi:hypothetical protein GLUCOINTEAF2_0202404 [Komagataeibacter intermedius AF2]|uniref:Uncharacterized protein n=1 Tax=Komagataeibacter intermedius AF2 TaxID=1458464 RepID=A0A0N1FBL7_9PROT|nr:hypothetical protein GLUCOINTEAF2_0202404 [Komagataeibacter intermedius AF2]